MHRIFILLLTEFYISFDLLNPIKCVTQTEQSNWVLQDKNFISKKEEKQRTVA